MDNPPVVLEGGPVNRAAAGDPNAFDALVVSRLDRLYVTANRILRNPASADDAVQQALVLAWRDLPSLRDHARLDAWLYRLLVRACYRDLRSQRRWAANVVDLNEVRSVDASAAADDRDALDRAFFAGSSPPRSSRSRRAPFGRACGTSTLESSEGSTPSAEADKRVASLTASGYTSGRRNITLPIGRAVQVDWDVPPGTFGSLGLHFRAIFVAAGSQVIQVDLLTTGTPSAQEAAAFLAILRSARVSEPASPAP